MNKMMENMKNKADMCLITLKHRVLRKESGIDGILVTIGLCIIALLLCVVMKDSLTTFIRTLVQSMTSKAQQILAGTIL